MNTTPTTQDELLVDAAELTISTQFGSTAMLQRKLHVGFARALRLMEELEAAGVIGPQNTGTARDVFITVAEMENALERIRAGRPAIAPVAPTTAPEFLQLDPTKLTTDKNVRTDLKLDKAFLASIEQHGVLEPIVAFPDPDNAGCYRVHIGHRRAAAAVQAGLTTVPVYIVTALAAQDRIVEQLVENLHREALTPLDEATAYKQLQLEGMPAIQIAKRTGSKMAHIGTGISIASTPAGIKVLDEHQVTLDQAATIVEFADNPVKVARLADIAASGGNIDHQAQQYRDAQIHEDALDAVAAELVAAGVTVLDESPSWNDPTFRPAEVVYADAARTTLVPIERIIAEAGADLYGVATNDHGTYDNDLRGWTAKKYFARYYVTNAHDHGWYVRPVDGGATGKGPLTDAEKDTRRQSRENTKLWISATAVRLAWIQQLLQRKTLPDGWILAVAQYVTDTTPGQTPTQRKAIANLLQVKQGTWPVDGTRDHLKANPNRAAHVALAVALGHREGSSDFDRKGWEAAAAGTYLTTLHGWGYPLSDLEQTLVTAAATKNAKAAA
jgi:ParB family chromosome partitioning protein